MGLGFIGFWVLRARFKASREVIKDMNACWTCLSPASGSYFLNSACLHECRKRIRTTFRGMLRVISEAIRYC